MSIYKYTIHWYIILIYFIYWYMNVCIYTHCYLVHLNYIAFHFKHNLYFKYICDNPYLWIWIYESIFIFLIFLHIFFNCILYFKCICTHTCITHFCLYTHRDTYMYVLTNLGILWNSCKFICHAKFSLNYRYASGLFLLNVGTWPGWFKHTIKERESINDLLRTTWKTFCEKQ